MSQSLYSPPNHINHDGYSYQLDKWSYANDYETVQAEYVPVDDIPYIDQRVYKTFTVE